MQYARALKGRAEKSRAEQSRVDWSREKQSRYRMDLHYKHKTIALYTIRDGAIHWY